MYTDEADIFKVNEWLKKYRAVENKVVKERIRELTVLSFMPLVKKIAHSFARRATDPLEDIIQVGSVGLIKAIDLFDPDIGSSFKTYASYFITGEIRHYLRDKSKIIRAPREIQELSMRIYNLTQKLTKELGKTPSDKEIAQALEISIDKVEEINNIERRTNTVSIDYLNDNFKEPSVYFEEKDASDKYKAVFSNLEDKIMLKDAMSYLEDDLIEIIDLSFFRELNQRQISERLGISQMQVSRKIKKALNRLFEIITDRAQKQEEV